MATQTSTTEEKRTSKEYPLHCLVWNNEVEAVKAFFTSHPPDQCDLERADPFGRTPLMLAVILGHTECVKLLLENNADANTQCKNGFTIVHEATCRADPELLSLVQQYRDYQRFLKRDSAIPKLLQALKESPDFYVEMKWEMTSWIPLVSNFCPTDTYKVYKSGGEVRIDTTLIGFENMKWLRGSRSYIFKGRKDHALFMEVNHDDKSVYRERIAVIPQEDNHLARMKPREEEISARLQSPVVSNYLDIDNIEFERNKSGVWGWRTEKKEVVSGHEANVFTASNVKFVTVTRTEHMTGDDKRRRGGGGGAGGSQAAAAGSLEAFLRLTDSSSNVNTANSTTSKQPDNIKPGDMSIADYLNGDGVCGVRREQQAKVDTFKATLWLCQEYPLSLQEQVLPIIDLMSTTSAHFAKLRDFITLQLPAGFPVKIDIPLYHVLSAKVTFSNIHASDTPVDGVTLIKDESASSSSATEVMMCAIDEACFDVPTGYSVVGLEDWSGLRGRGNPPDEERLLQLAIEQSLLQSGTEGDQVTVWEALSASGGSSTTPPHQNTTRRAPTNQPIYMSNHLYSEESLALQRVIEESLRMSMAPPAKPAAGADKRVADSGENVEDNGENVAESGECVADSVENVGEGGGNVTEWGEEEEGGALVEEDTFAGDLEMALRLSQQEQQDIDRRRRQEDDELEEILRLSLTEK